MISAAKIESNASPVRTGPLASTSRPNQEPAGRLTQDLVKVSASHVRPARQSAGEPKTTSHNGTLFNQLTRVSSGRTRAVIYVPFHNRDMVIQAMSLNAGRIIKGKPPLPVIGAQENMLAFKASVADTREAESKGKLHMAQKADALMEKVMADTRTLGEDAVTLRQLFDVHPDQVTRVAEYRAINQLSTVNPKALPEKSIDTVYVLGHGEAGTPQLFDLSTRAGRGKPIAQAMQEVGTLLAGKVTDGVKIKVTACESADRETVESLKNIPENISKKVRGVAPLAMSAKAEISKHIPGARVFGYHGLGISRGTDYIGKARCAASDFNDDTGKVSSFVKPSQVRKEF